MKCTKLSGTPKKVKCIEIMEQRKYKFKVLKRIIDGGNEFGEENNY